jgi:hypothetical protein
MTAVAKRGEWHIMPLTFILPHEYNKFVAAFYAEVLLHTLTGLLSSLSQASHPCSCTSFSVCALAAPRIDGSLTCFSFSPSLSLSLFQEEAIKAARLPVQCPNYWILKPVGLSRGRGISLISDIGAVKYDSQTVSTTRDNRHSCIPAFSHGPRKQNHPDLVRAAPVACRRL